MGSAKHTHNSNFTSKTFQQGYSGWLHTKPGSHTKCKTENQSKSNAVARKTHKTYHTSINVFNLYQHLKSLEVKQY